MVRHIPFWVSLSARRTLAFGAAQCVAIIFEIELRVILKSRESLDDLHRHGIWLAPGL